MMTNDDYLSRRIRHRSSGQEGRIFFLMSDVLGTVFYIVHFDNGSIDSISKANLEHAFEILPLDANVVQFRPRSRAVTVAAYPNGGSAA